MRKLGPRRDPHIMTFTYAFIDILRSPPPRTQPHRQRLTRKHASQSPLWPRYHAASYARKWRGFTVTIFHMGYGPACVSRELLWTRGIIRIRTRTARGGFYEVALRGEIFGSESTKHVDDDKLDSKLNGGYLPTSEDRSATFVSRKRSWYVPPIPLLMILLSQVLLFLAKYNTNPTQHSPGRWFACHMMKLTRIYCFLLRERTPQKYALRI